MVLDVILQARDRGLFHAITDCGAGGFSSAVGEMGAELRRRGRPRNARRSSTQGSRYTEIWISEAQERMVLAVPPRDAGRRCRSSAQRRTSRRPTSASSSTPGGSRSATTARWSATCRWTSCTTAGPPVVREASFTPPPERPLELPEPARLHGRPARAARGTGTSAARSGSSASTTTRSRAATVHQAAGRRPRRRAGRRGGDPAGARARTAAWRSPAASTRATAARPLRDGGLRHRRGDPQLRGRGRPIPRRIALLDNFCWGNTERPETPGLAGAGRPGLPRRGAGLRHAVHLRQGQPEQRIHARGPEPGHPADAPDQRDRPGARRPRAA